MKKVQIKNITQNNVVISEAEVADHFITRLRGLLGRRSLDDNTGLIIRPCKSVHMFGMKFSIDVIFVDKNHKVCYLISALKKMRMSPYIKKAKYVIEAPVGTIVTKKVNINDTLECV